MFVNLIAPINNLGYGVTGFNVLKALHKAGHQVSLFPVNNPLQDRDLEPYLKDIEIIKTSLANAKLYDPTAPCVRIWHQHELDKFVGKGERIGWPIFELNKFKDQELHQLNSVDRLFVCSEWAKTICQENGVNVPIDVIPLGVDPEVFFVDSDARKNRPYWTKDTTVFLNVGKWEVRKGHNELCEAFSKAFTKDDDVKLWMMNTNDFIGPKGNETWKRKYISSELGMKVDLLPRMKTQEQMRQVFNHVDFGVFPAHAEGWNLEVIELMACGVPSIVTNYSGHTEFCNRINSFLVEPKGMEPAKDGVWFHGEGEWCTYSVDDLVDKMREAHGLKQTEVNNLKPDVEPVYSGALGRRIHECNITAKKFTWENSVKKIVEVL